MSINDFWIKLQHGSQLEEIFEQLDMSSSMIKWKNNFTIEQMVTDEEIEPYVEGSLKNITIEEKLKIKQIHYNDVTDIDWIDSEYLIGDITCSKNLLHDLNHHNFVNKKISVDYLKEKGIDDFFENDESKWIGILGGGIILPFRLIEKLCQIHKIEFLCKVEDVYNNTIKIISITQNNNYNINTLTLDVESIIKYNINEDVVKYCLYKSEKKELAMISALYDKDIKGIEDYMKELCNYTTFIEYQDEVKNKIKYNDSMFKVTCEYFTSLCNSYILYSKFNEIINPIVLYKGEIKKI